MAESQQVGQNAKCKCCQPTGAHTLGERTHVKEPGLLLTLLQNIYTRSV